MATLASLSKRLREALDNSLVKAQKAYENPTRIKTPRFDETKMRSIPLNAASGFAESLINEPISIVKDVGTGVGKAITGDLNNFNPTSNTMRLTNNVIDSISTKQNPLSTVKLSGYGKGKWNVPFTGINLPEMGFSESPAAGMGKQAIGILEPFMAAAGVKKPLAVAGYTALGSGANALLGDRKDSLEQRLIKGANRAAPDAAVSAGFLTKTNPFLDKIGGKAITRLPLKSGANVAQGVGLNELTGQENSGASVLLDALFPLAGELATKTFKSSQEAARATEARLKSVLGKSIRNNRGMYTTAEKFAKGTRPYRKSGKYVQGGLLGFEPYQDEDGSWKVRFNRGRALLGLGITAGISKAGNLTDDVLKGVDGKQIDPLITEARKYKSADEFVKNNDLIFQGGKPGTTSPFWSTKIGEANAYAAQKGLKDGEIRVARFSYIYPNITGGLSKQEWFAKYGSQIGGNKELNPKIITILQADKTGLKGDSQLTDIWNQSKGNVSASQINPSAIKEKLSRGFLEIDGSDINAVKGVFKNAGYVDIDGFQVHPSVDPQWVRDLSPQTKQLMRENGVTYIDHTAGSSGVAVSKSLGGNKVRGISVASDASKGSGLYSNKDSVISHEIGHHRWGELTPQQQADYAKGMTNTPYGSRIASGESKSAGSVAEENFAENFAKQQTGKYAGGDSLPNQANRVSANQDLINEARKYKSAEEFMSNYKKVFHQTSPVSPQIQPTKMPISKQSSTQSFDKSLAEIEKTVYGSATPSQAELGGTKDSAGFLTDILRRGQAGVSSKVGSLAESPKAAVRNIGRLLEGFGGGLGKTQTQVEAKGVFGGGKDYAAKIGGDVQKHVNNVLSNSKESAARVWEILDPELSKTKLTYEDLTPQEKEATDFLRQVSDFINDTNHKNGFISDELWRKNKGGKYVARAYEPFDLPPEVADFVKQSQAKFDLNQFKQRTEVNDWKEANAMRDSAYLMGKRLQQTLFNDSVHKMSASMMKTGLVSDVAKPGYVQVSDHKAYGEMAGKWVRKDALEDIKGFFYESDVAQKAYDLISWYDRNPVRKTYKKLFTVFNPAVRLGNKTGNYVFAWMSGINPATFAKNQMAAKGEVKNSGPLFRRALKDGLVGTDITKADITKMAVELKSGVQDKNILRRIDETLQNRYGETDDIAKVAALKTFLDRGYTYQEAARRVYNGFQNYRTIGWLYDVGAKIPILGNPFVRFKADFGRILKNSVIEHPFRVAGTVMAYQLFTDVMSRASGETAQDKDTRENRFGSPRIPFTQTSLAVQTPWGEINAARLIGAYGINLGENDLAGDISDYSPIKNPLDKRNYGTDPMVGPVISTAMDTDFRGKSIKDPNQSKYVGSLLTPKEQRINQGKFLLRAYSPTAINSTADIIPALQGKPDFYGRTKTPAQAALRTFPGIKLEQFGAKEAQALRDREALFEENKSKSLKSKIGIINKQLDDGEITEDQARNRINALQTGGKNTYEKSEDAPKNIVEKTALYGKALQKDPSGAIKGMFTEERARKMRGDALVFERKKNLNQGGTGLERDHTVSLGLGGDNSPENLRDYPHGVKVKKDALEKKLIRQLENGEITEAQAQAEIKAWTADTPVVTETKDTIAKVYKIKNPTGTVSKIDISTPIVKPKATGLTELDKGLISKYNSAVSTRINNIEKVYLDGQITAQQAEDAISKLKEAKISTAKAKAKKGVRVSMRKIKPIKVSFSEVSAPKLSKLKIKSPKLAKLKLAKLKPAKGLKITRKVARNKGKPIKFRNTLSDSLTKLV